MNDVHALHDPEASRELDVLRGLRGDMPPMDESVRDGIRANLLTLADDDAMPLGAPRVPRTRKERRAVLPIAAAVLLTVGIGAGIAVVRDTGGGHSGVQAGTYRTPGMHQWVYTRTFQAAGFDMNTWYKGVDPATSETSEMWRRVDGQGQASLDRNGKLSVRVIDSKAKGGVPLVMPTELTNRIAEYEKFPTDPDALLRRLTTKQKLRPVKRTIPGNGSFSIIGGSGPTGFEAVREMLRYPLPPGLQKALYQVLPRIPGVVVRPGITDFAGRRGVGFSFTTQGGDRNTLIIDPVTYRYLGIVEDAVADYRSGGSLVRKGTLLLSDAVVECKIVNEAGQR
ncbi:CU044_5270 family protein [Actinomadura oligospora]|uniref:CU044_5270 family protein n=1 Tax=Actinomadura oligospora TaxID=111804 RepID=UPI00047B4B82|nr:CU044_5270 family protein [Actinomadura oligospora]